MPAIDPASQYINDLGQQLASVAPGYKFPYAFKIVREKSVSALALPGGPIYVHTGLIEKANEGELAGVMGHEIAHLVMRHSARQPCGLLSRKMSGYTWRAVPANILFLAMAVTAGPKSIHLPSPSA